MFSCEVIAGAAKGDQCECLPGSGGEAGAGSVHSGPPNILETKQMRSGVQDTQGPDPVQGKQSMSRRITRREKQVAAQMEVSFSHKSKVLAC